MSWDETADRWPGRNAAIAAFIPPGVSVIDLGAGRSSLEAMLPAGCRYTAADLPEFDMDRGKWPDGHWDVAVMSGVLEYARFPAAVLRHLHEIATVALVSYATDMKRRDPRWNTLTADDVVRLADKAGFTATAVGTWRTRGVRPQTIWRLA